MKIAVISDIHANLFALEAVLAHAENQGIKYFWCLGDQIQFNAFPDQVVKTVRKMDPVAIQGNVDRAILKVGKKKEENITQDEMPFYWTYKQLSRKNREYLSDLPSTTKVKLKGYRFLLTHGSPKDIADNVYADTPDEYLRELTKLTRADFILCGHTHKPFIREVDGISFINPGSVGKPVDGDPRASYCVIQVKKGFVTIDHYRVEYDLASALNAMREYTLPDIYIRALETSVLQSQLAEPEPAKE